MNSPTPSNTPTIPQRWTDEDIQRSVARVWERYISEPWIFRGQRWQDENYKSGDLPVPDDLSEVSTSDTVFADYDSGGGPDPDLGGSDSDAEEECPQLVSV